MMDGYYGMWGGGLLMVLFWLVFVVVAIWGLRSLFPGHASVDSRSVSSPLDVVQMRYSRAEYLAFVEDLKQTKETGR